MSDTRPSPDHAPIVYSVRRVCFPNAGNAAAVVANPDGSFTIFLNTRFEASVQSDALRHELSHLEHGDFSSALPLSEIEARAGAVSLPDVRGDTIPYFGSEAALAEWILRQEIDNLFHA